MGYSGVLPQAIKQNKLIEAGKRFSKSVPQLPFVNKTAPKIERAGVVKRLSPSMNKTRTFTSKKSKFNYMFSNLASFATRNDQYQPTNTQTLPPPYYPYPQPYVDSPVTYRQPPSNYQPLQQQQTKDYQRNYAYPDEDPRFRLQQNSEARKRIGEGRGLSNVALNTSRETRQWLNTGNSVAREARGTLRYLKIAPEDLFF